MCKSIASPKFEDYISKKKNITVKDIATYHCSSQDCDFTWLPSEEEDKIDKALGIKKCGICKRPLNMKNPLSKDCGGDCLKCMAAAGDPQAIDLVKNL